MAVMLIATVPGSKAEQQEHLADRLGSQVKERDGFLFHAGGPVEQGWRLYEAWETREQLDDWLQGTVLPNLPDDAPEPEMRFVPIEIVIKP